MVDLYRTALFVMILTAIAGVAFAAGIGWSTNAHAASPQSGPRSAKNVRVVYPKTTDLDFEGTEIQGELKNPGEFYFQRRPEEKFDSLVKRRKNFHRELLRDAVLGK